MKKYKNGNYYVLISEDGTKVRYSYNKKIQSIDDLKPKFPETIDFKITNYCDGNCKYCYENSTIKGNHSDMVSNFNNKFLRSIPAGTELAIGGGNPLSHPGLGNFLKYMSNRGVICNITVNIRHLNLANFKKLYALQKLGYLHGIGISISSLGYQRNLNLAKKLSNVVYHIVLGLYDVDTMIKRFENQRVLFLGYKVMGRGKDSEIISSLEKYSYLDIENILFHFKASFDNLSIKELKLKEHLTQNQWDTYFLGEDGKFSMYVDAVTGKAAISSLEPKENQITLCKSLKKTFKELKKQTMNSDEAFINLKLEENYDK